MAGPAHFRAEEWGQPVLKIAAQPRMQPTWIEVGRREALDGARGWPEEAVGRRETGLTVRRLD